MTGYSTPCFQIHCNLSQQLWKAMSRMEILPPHHLHHQWQTIIIIIILCRSMNGFSNRFEKTRFDNFTLQLKILLFRKKHCVWSLPLWQPNQESFRNFRLLNFVTSTNTASPVARVTSLWQLISSFAITNKSILKESCWRRKLMNGMKNTRRFQRMYFGEQGSQYYRKIKSRTTTATTKISRTRRQQNDS